MSLEYEHQTIDKRFNQLTPEFFDEAIKQISEIVQKEKEIILHNQKFEDEVVKEIKNMINKEII